MELRKSGMTDEMKRGFDFTTCLHFLPAILISTFIFTSAGALRAPL
jgi:hypothetical protein